MKQKAGNCRAAAAHGSAPSDPSLRLPSSYVTMWRVVIGATQLTQLGPEAQVRNIKRLLVHERYSNISERNDIALLELDQPVQCSYYIQLACVPDASLRVSELTTCYVSGWGSTTARCEFPKSTRVPSMSSARWGKGLGFLTAEAKARARLRGRMPVYREMGLTRYPKHDRRETQVQHHQGAKPSPREGVHPARGAELVMSCWVLIPSCAHSWKIS